MSGLQGFLTAYLLNALWQVPLLFVTATLAARLLRRHRSVATYRLWVLSLSAQVLLPALSTEAEAIQRALARLWHHEPGGSSGRITVSFGPVAALHALRLPPALSFALTLGYGLALLYAAVRLATGLRRTWILRRDAAGAVLSEEQAELWERCRVRFGVPAARLLENTAVGVPLTLGVRRPCVLLPAGLLSQTPSRDLETLFAHECAHMGRRDFFWNVVYQSLALPIALHPLLPRTLRALAESREWVCDDLAAACVGTSQAYARSLLRLAMQLLPAAPAPSTHAIGMLDANALERRLMHLTHRSTQGSVLHRTATLACCGLLGVATCGSAWAWHTAIPAPAMQQDSNQPVRISGGVMAGMAQTKVAPIYPPEAKAQGIQGSVVLNAVISAEGVVEELSVVSGPEKLQQAALDAVKQWTYKPFQLNGNPVPVSTVITVNFQLQP